MVSKKGISIAEAPLGEPITIYTKVELPQTDMQGIITEWHGEDKHFIKCNVLQLVPYGNDITGQMLHGMQLEKSKTTFTPFSEKERKFLFKGKGLTNLLWCLSVSGGTIGTDPELFAVDKNGVVIPAFKFLPSKKEGNPFWDGFQCEFTLGQPGTCLAYMTDATHNKMRDLHNCLIKHDPKARLIYKDVIDIPKEMMMTALPEHIQLGCAPSKNIYDLPPIQVEDAALLPFRFAGCHLHFGLPPYHKAYKDGIIITNIIKTMDALYGVMSVPLLQGMEDPRRRQFYGKAGEFRLPKHGLEYRVPSSAMMAHPALFHLSFDLARASFHLGYRFKTFLKDWGTTDEEVVNIINNYDVLSAHKVMKRNKEAIIVLLSRIYGGEENRTKRIWDFIYNGAINIMDINDIAGTWRLKGQGWSTHSGSTDCCFSNFISNLIDREKVKSRVKTML